MSAFSIGPMPAGQEAQRRFAAPAIPAKPLSNASDATPSWIQGTDPTTISAELAGLLGPGLQRERPGTLSLARRRLEAVARKDPRDASHAGEDPGAEPSGVTSFAYAGRQSSSGQHRDGGGNDGTSRRLRWPETVTAFQMGHGEARSQAGRHMALIAADLPQRCAAHRSTHGIDAMPLFLRGALVDLLPGFMRDLCEKLDAWAVGLHALHPGDAVRPVGEVCQEFLTLLRPLYADHVAAHGLYLVSDVRQVLCAAQALLGDEMQKRAEGHPHLARVLRKTVYPLWPLLVMACMPRPAQAPGRSTHVIEEVSV